MIRTIKKLGVALVLLTVITALGYVSRGIPDALAQSVSNYFSQPAGAGKGNTLNLNGTVKTKSVRVPTDATFTVAAESGNNVDTQIIFKDGDGTAIAYPFQTYCWTSPASTGAAYVTTAATAVFSAVTNGTVESVTSGKSANVITSAAGLLGIRDTQTSNTVLDAYLCCSLALGRTACSGAIDH